MEYGKRWTVETFFSGLKQTTGSMLTSRQPTQLLAKAAFRVLAYILRRYGLKIMRMVSTEHRSVPAEHL